MDRLLDEIDDYLVVIRSRLRNMRISPTAKYSDRDQKQLQELRDQLDSTFEMIGTLHAWEEESDD